MNRSDYFIHQDSATELQKERQRVLEEQFVPFQKLIESNDYEEVKRQLEQTSIILSLPLSPLPLSLPTTSFFLLLTHHHFRSRCTIDQLGSPQSTQK
jgi:hypothetical protein